MGNVPSRLCSIHSPPPSPSPSPPPSPSKAFTQRPFLLSTQPSPLKSTKCTSTDGASLRTRAPSLLSRSTSQVHRLLPLSSSLHQRSLSEKRLSPRTEELIASEFGLNPGATKVLYCLPSNQQPRSQTPAASSSAASSDRPPRAVFGSPVATSSMPPGRSEGTGSARKQPRRWSLRDLTRKGRGEGGSFLNRRLSLGEGDMARYRLSVGNESPAPSTSTYDEILIARYQLLKILRGWAVGDLHATDVELVGKWSTLLSLSQAALSDAPGSVKHLVRIGDAINASLALLPGAGEHAHLLAEVSDGCKEIVEMVRDTVDGSRSRSPVSSEHSSGWPSLITKSIRGRVDTSPASSRRDLEINTNITERAPRRDVVCFDQSVFIPPRPAFMDDESSCGTPALDYTSSPHLDEVSPVGPFTPAIDETFASAFSPLPASPTLLASPPWHGTIAATDAPTNFGDASAPSNKPESAPASDFPFGRPSSYDAYLVVSTPPRPTSTSSQAMSSSTIFTNHRDENSLTSDPPSPNPSQAGTFGYTSRESMVPALPPTFTKSGGAPSTSSDGSRLSGLMMIGERGWAFGALEEEE